MKQLLATILVLVSSLASAAEKPCWEAPSTVKRAQCHAEKLKALDVELNAEYKDAMAVLKQPNPRVTAEDFRSAQRLWLKFIEADCSVKSKLYGNGLWETIEYYQCKEQYFEKRIYLFKIASGKAAP